MRQFYHKSYWGKYVPVESRAVIKTHGVWIALHFPVSPSAVKGETLTNPHRWMSSELSTGVPVLAHNDAVKTVEECVYATSEILDRHKDEIQSKLREFKQMNILPEE